MVCSSPLHHKWMKKRIYIPFEKLYLWLKFVCYVAIFNNTKGEQQIIFKILPFLFLIISKL